MKKQDGYYYVESREVDLKRMLWWIARQWRTLIILAIACACVMCAWKYNKDYKANQAAYEAALKQNEDRKTIEGLTEKLTEAEYKGVQRALYYYEMEQAALEYLGNSILMNANPYEISVAKIYYKSENVNTVCSRLKQFVSSQEFVEELVDKLDWEVEERYLLELYEVSNSDEEIVITIKADTQEKSKELAELTMEVIANVFAGVYDDVYYTLGIMTDLNLVSIYNDINDHRSAYSSTFNNYQGNFTTDQDALFILLQAEKEGIDIYASSQDNMVVELQETHISKSMLLLGAVAGALTGIVFMAIGFTFSSKIHGKEEVKKLFNIPIMGNVDITTLKKKRGFAFVDKFVNILVYGKNIYEEQMQIIVANIYLVCKKNNLKKVVLAGSKMEQISERLLQDIETELMKKEIDTVVAKSISYDAESLIAAAEVGSVVFVEIDENSKCEEIAAELNLCVQNQIESLGVIVVQA